MANEVRDVPENERYELRVDGELAGFADYRRDGQRVLLPHAEVDPSRRGRGLATELAAAVYADLEARGLEAVPTCGFMRVKQPH